MSLSSLMLPCTLRHEATLTLDPTLNPKPLHFAASCSAHPRKVVRGFWGSSRGRYRVPPSAAHSSPAEDAHCCEKVAGFQRIPSPVPETHYTPFAVQVKTGFLWNELSPCQRPRSKCGSRHGSRWQTGDSGARPRESLQAGTACLSLPDTRTRAGRQHAACTCCDSCWMPR